MKMFQTLISTDAQRKQVSENVNISNRGNDVAPQQETNQQMPPADIEEIMFSSESSRTQDKSVHLKKEVPLHCIDKDMEIELENQDGGVTEKSISDCPLTNSHMRGINSDYMNQQSQFSSKSTGNASSKLTPFELNAQQRQQFIDRISKSNEFCSREMFDAALAELKMVEQSPLVQTNQAFRAVFYYNLGCCYHRQTLIAPCCEAMKEVIAALEQDPLCLRNGESTDTKAESQQASCPRQGATKVQQSPCEQLQQTRVLCKVTLQLCAIMSQANDHDSALELAQKADSLAKKLAEYTNQVCQIYIDSIQQQDRQQMSHQISNDQEIQESEEIIDDYDDGDYTPLDIQRTKNGPTNTTQNVRRESTIEAQAYGRLKTSQPYLESSETKSIESSFVSSSYKSKNEKHSSSSKLQFQKRTSSQSGTRKKIVEDQSLERIHTFHLKKSPFKEEQESLMEKVQLQMIEDATTDLQKFQKQNGIKKGDSSQEITQFCSLDCRNKARTTGSLIISASLDKAYYLQEKASVQQDAIIRNMYPVIAELSRLLQRASSNLADFESGYKLLRSHFSEDKDIDILKSNNSFKLSIRNILGLPKSSLSNIGKPLGKFGANEKSEARDPQWIYHLNIGNVMHLVPMTVEEMQKLERIKNSAVENEQGSPNSAVAVRTTLTSPQINIQIDPRQCQTITALPLDQLQKDELLSQIKFELSKDEMLDKIILIIVALFCMGTELRFKSQQYAPPQGFKGVHEMDTIYQSIRSSSECWHANAIHIAAIFLPDECPLVGHMINSYKKHHMRSKASKKSEQFLSKYKEKNSLAPNEQQAVISQNSQESSNNLVDKKKQQLIQQLMSTKPLHINGSGGSLKNKNPIFGDSRRQSESLALKQAEKVQQALKQTVVSKVIDLTDNTHNFQGSITLKSIKNQQVKGQLTSQILEGKPNPWPKQEKTRNILNGCGSKTVGITLQKTQNISTKQKVPCSPTVKIFSQNQGSLAVTSQQQLLKLAVTPSRNPAMISSLPNNHTALTNAQQRQWTSPNSSQRSPREHLKAAQHNKAENFVSIFQSAQSPLIQLQSLPAYAKFSQEMRRSSRGCDKNKQGQQKFIIETISTLDCNQQASLLADLNTSRMSDIAVDDGVNLLNDDQNIGRMILKREFGVIKKPKDVPRKNLIGKEGAAHIDVKILQCSPRTKNYEQNQKAANPEATAFFTSCLATLPEMRNLRENRICASKGDRLASISERSLSDRSPQMNKYRSESNMKLDDLLKQFQQIKVNTLLGQKK